MMQTITQKGTGLIQESLTDVGISTATADMLMSSTTAVNSGTDLLQVATSSAAAGILAINEHIQTEGWFSFVSSIVSFFGW